LRRVGIQLLKNAFLAVLRFVLRLACAKGFRQIVPEFEEALVQHNQNSADVARAIAIKIKSSSGRVEVFRFRTVSLAVEELHCHKRIKKISDAPWVQTELFANLRAHEPSLAEAGE